ncbi:MAG: protein-L-isoaspartate O-methyltransferase [bacterium]
MVLIEGLIKEGWLKTPEIITAFKNIKRADFIPEGFRHFSELNEALLIGHNQTISQPLVVAFMLELLNPKLGDKVMDIGSGSGYTTALLANIVGKKSNLQFSIYNFQTRGRVVAVEIIPELMEFGRANADKYEFVKKGIVEFICADGSNGYKKEAPYDAILASASGKQIPRAWKQQLKIGGRIVAPVRDSIWLIEKIGDNKYRETEYPGFVFVPLIVK